MQFEDLIRGQKVIFVGPSPILINKRLGKFIENFDIVVRPNGAGILSEDLFSDYGKRTDILYTNRQYIDDNHPLNIRELKKRGLQFICFKNNRKHLFDYYKPYFGVRGIRHVINKLHKLNIYGLLYGNAIITDLLSFQPKELFITGIDCYINKPVQFVDDGFKEYIPNYFTPELKEKYAKNNIGRIDNHDKYTNTKYLYSLYKAGKIKTNDFIVEIMEEIVIHNPKKYKVTGHL